MAIQDHDWFTVIVAEIVAWTVIYWQRGGRWKLLWEAIDSKASLGGNTSPSTGSGTSSTSSTSNPATSVTPSSINQSLGVTTGSGKG